MAPINSFYVESLTVTESYICKFLHSIWNWHVPTFVIVSGVLFLNPLKKIPVNKLLSKYFLRIILAIIIFGIPYAFLEIFFDANYHFNIKQIWFSIVNVFQGKLWDHMWYLYMIAGLYLVIPIIKIFVENVERKMVEYILLVLFLFTSVIPFFETVLSIKFCIYIPINSVYLFYLLLGYYIHYYKININNAVLFSIIILYIAYIFIMPLDGMLKLPIGYNSPIIIIMTASLFCVMRQFNISSKLCDMLSPLCFGVYLLHPLFINFLYKFIKMTPNNYPVVYVIIIATVITVILSIIFTYLLRRIILLKKYVL